METVGIGARLFLGILLGYVIVSVTESVLHRHVGHASANTRRVWKKTAGRLYRYVFRSFYSHHVVHHVLTYRVNHVTQFKDDGEKQRVDGLLLPELAESIKSEHYGLTLRGVGIIRFVAPVLPLFAVVYYFFEMSVVAGASLPLIVYPLMSKVIHPWLHRPFSEIQRDAHPLICALFHTYYVKAMVKSHFLHHKYLHCNYNLMLGGDILTGVYRRASSDDLDEMKSLGLNID